MVRVAWFTSISLVRLGEASSMCTRGPVELMGCLGAVTGNEVTEFVCADDYQEDYTFDCPLEDGSRARSDAFKAAPRGVAAIVSLQLSHTSPCRPAVVRRGYGHSSMV